MKLETTSAALATQSASIGAAAAAATNQWWFAIIAAAIGTLFAVHAEGAYKPGEIRKVIVRILMLTAFSWLIGVFLIGLPTIPFLDRSNPLADTPEWARSMFVGLFSPYLYSICVTFLRQRRDALASSPTN